jgi:hypothetical protein
MATTVKEVKDEDSSDTKEFGDTIGLSDLDTRIAELAYYKAESRGFEPGHELEDWFEAEQDLYGKVDQHKFINALR